MYHLKWNRDISHFKDILEDRRKEKSNFMYMSRSLNNIISPYTDTIKLTPTQFKNETLKTRAIQYLIDKFSTEYISKKDIIYQIKVILDEIGFKRNYNVIRWFGLILIKFCLNVSNGIFVNEAALLNIRSNMGKVQIVYVPSHRSYADFILMSYICFSYDIEIPAIAAGMDFHAMWGMGKLLRDTGAFFMRRSFNDDKLYWNTFQEYIYTIISKGQQGIEFFIEGTRSRSGKSLVPKTGLLSMILKAYFKSEVPDILFVPINFSYDRVLEENLFAFELLGVPKPKESTSGFLKSFRLMKEDYGTIYVDIAKPISAHDYFANKTDKLIHNMNPKYLTIVSKDEKEAMQLFANDILYTQQKHCTISTFNLLSLILMNNLTTEKDLLTRQSLISEIVWIKTILEKLGALVIVKDLDVDLENALRTHKNLVLVNDENRVQLVQNEILLKDVDVRKFKAHTLSENTMALCVPFIMLQIYVNNCLHYFVNASVISLIVNFYQAVDLGELRMQFTFLRGLFAKEFVFSTYYEEKEFMDNVDKMLEFGVIIEDNGRFRIGQNRKLLQFLIRLLDPFVLSYYMVLTFFNQINVNCVEKDALIWCQSKLEQLLTKREIFIHPYSLCLDTLSNCLQNLTVLGVISKLKSGSNYSLVVNKERLYDIINKFDQFLPKMYKDNLNVLLYNNSKL